MVPKVFTFPVLERSKGASPDPQPGFQPSVPSCPPSQQLQVMLEDARVYRKWDPMMQFP